MSWTTVLQNQKSIKHSKSDINNEDSDFFKLTTITPCRLHKTLYFRLDQVYVTLMSLTLRYFRSSASLEFAQAVFTRLYLWIYDQDSRKTILTSNKNAVAKSSTGLPRHVSHLRISY